ncbi:MAG: metallophosphoesterase family protein [Planctomycetes bacterium]|nr:metallophosphoesterase family protein [Planctomycetota bacterium]
MSECRKIAVFGGVYNNHLALTAALEDARRRGADTAFCLGDMGAFGPHPDRTISILREHDVQCIQGNYDNSIGNELPDCQCGYTDPRDNHFARISYAYTLANTSLTNREWLRQLPAQRRVRLGKYRVFMCHGSPRRTNEFLWESTTSTHFLEHLCRNYDADVILATHTGIKWHRPLADGRQFVNVGVLGRPENDGRTNVWYALLSAESDFQVEFVPVAYDHERLAAQMRSENLPGEFVATILSGWWTTCLEVLPAKERRRGRY